MDAPNPLAESGMMSRSSTATLVALLLAATIAVPNPGAAEYTQQENIVYGHKDGLGLLMDVFTPRKQNGAGVIWTCLLYTSPSPRDQRGSRMPSSA